MTNSLALATNKIIAYFLFLLKREKGKDIARDFLPFSFSPFNVEANYEFGKMEVLILTLILNFLLF